MELEIITKAELQIKLELHLKWIRNEDGGERADLRYADLRYADLSYANLSSADLRSADLRYADLRSANLSYAELSSANLSSANLRYANLSSAILRYANLSSANLRYANLRYANLDFSCWPLWCGSKGVKVDLKIIRQLCAHICVVDNNTKEFRAIKKALMEYAVKSHRANDLELKGETNK
ncbi:MAG: pentapeptide repeat-containing protein [Candidatus Izemoplasmatales bacterium]